MRADGTFKLSFYNIILDESAAEVQLWNTKRGSIVKLERPVYEEFERSDFEGAGKQYIETLLKEGVLVPAGLNERQEILFRARQRQYSTAYESFGFVVAPTLACNFHCPFRFKNGYNASRLLYNKKRVETGIPDFDSVFFGWEFCETISVLLVLRQTALS